VRGKLQGGVGHETAAATGLVRHVSQEGKKHFSDRLTRLVPLLELSEHLAASVIIRAKRLQEEGTLVAICRVKARPIDAGAVHQVLHGRSLVAASPKRLQCPIKDFRFVELLLPWHRAFLLGAT